MSSTVQTHHIVACLGTGDAVQIGNSFCYNLTYRQFNYFLHCYTFTQLTILTRQYSILSIRSVWHSLRKLRNCRPLTANWLSRSSFQDNSSARTPRKTVTPLLRVRLLNCCIAMVTAQTHRKPVM
jgi:hypothetical protein